MEEHDVFPEFSSDLTGMNPFANFYSSSHSHVVVDPKRAQVPPLAPGQKLLLKEKLQKGSYDHVLLLSPGAIEVEKFLEACGAKVTHVSTSPHGSRLESQTIAGDNWADVHDFVRREPESRALLVVWGVLENYFDIRPLLAGMRELLLNKAVSDGLVIFARDDKKQKHGTYHTWSSSAAKHLLEASGLMVTVAARHRMTYSINCTSESYEKFLRTHHMPAPNFEHLLVTTEHPDYRITGGLGSYIKECSTFYGDGSAIMMIDNNQDVDMARIRQYSWLSLQGMFDEAVIDQMIKIDHNHLSGVIYQALLSVMFYYPRIVSIEFQEGAAFRVIQAKKARLFPNVQLITSCHGSSFFLARARQDFVEPELVQNAYREKYCVEESDLAIFPTKYLETSYRAMGVEPKNFIIRRLPFNLEGIPHGALPEKYKRLVYVGKTNKTKGFDIFLGTLLEIHSARPDITEQIEEVVAIVTYTEVHELYIQSLLEAVQRLYNISIISLPRPELMARLAEYAKDSLALVTYPGDNHPTVVLELMAIGHDFVALEAGGTPELIKQSLQADFLVTPNSKAVADFVIDQLPKITERALKVEHLRSWYGKEQRTINASYSLERMYQYVQPSTLGGDVNLLPYSVAVPVYNTPQMQIADLCIGISAQTVMPNEVIFVNDGSAEGYEDELRRTLKAQLNCPFRIVTQKNKGLAGARNRGLHEATTDLVVFIDSDDVPLNNGFEVLVRRLSEDSGMAIATGFCKYFVDGKDDFRDYVFMNGEHQPIGALLGTAFYPQNNFGCASTCVRRLAIEELGGWDDSDKSMWEDWAFYIKAASHGLKYAVVPQVVYMYRVREDSMLRSYPVFPAENRLIRNFDALPVFDAYILYAQLKAFNRMYFEGILPPHLQTPEMPPPPMGGIEKAAAVYRTRVPVPVRRALYLTSRSGYRALRTVYRLGNILKTK